MIRNNNQNGRRRGRGGARPPQGGGPSGNYGNNNGGGSRIDTRQRGNATQLLEKYKAMARDATQNGDRVQAEFYMQYADHYYRVLNEFRARDPQPAPRANYDDDDGYETSTVGQNYAAAQPGSYADDGDDEDEGDDAPRSVAQPPERQSYDRPNPDRQQGERQAYDRNRNSGGNGANPQRAYNGQRDGNQQRDGGQQRDNGQTREGYQSRDGGQQRDNGQTREGYQSRDNGQRDNQRDSGQRDAQPRDNGQRDGQRDVDQRAGARDADAPRTSEPRAPERVRAPVRPEPEPVETMIAGLPGPATIATGAAETALPTTVENAASADAAEPVKRPRGRPRKVVAAADAADA